MTIKQRIDAINWEDATHQIHDKGYALFPGILESDQCEALVSEYNDTKLYRKTINMAQYRFGQGEYKYYRYPLPDIAAQLRELIYPHLAPLANKWMQLLGITQSYPEDHETFLEQCHLVGQQRPTPLILKYGSGGYNTLHQDLYGEVFFPFQAIVLLSKPNDDFTGGELLLTEQRPWAQSKGIVLQPQQGDLAIITTSFRPVQGAKGFYRVNLKHGVSEVLSGKRYTLGIIFHDAR